jgi:hypothetical protein
MIRDIQKDVKTILKSVLNGIEIFSKLKNNVKEKSYKQKY